MGQNISYTEEMHSLLRESLYGMLTVLRPDGMPSTNPVSYTWDGTLVRVSTLKSRYKYKSLLQDQRVAIFRQGMRHRDVENRSGGVRWGVVAVRMSRDLNSLNWHLLRQWFQRDLKRVCRSFDLIRSGSLCDEVRLV